MRIAGIFSILSVATSAWAAAPYAYVANNGDMSTKDGTIAVIDWASAKVITTIEVTGRPFSVASAPNDNFVYVLSEDDTNNDSVLSVISTHTNRVVRTETLAGAGADGPSSVAVTPDGNSLWITRHDGGIAIMCAHIFKILHTITIEDGEADIAAISFLPNGKTAYILGSDINGSFVSAIDATSRQVTANIPYGTYAASMALTPDGRFLYAGDYIGPVNVISTQTNSIVTVIPIDYAPCIAATPDSHHIWISSESIDFSTSQINIVDVATNNVIQTTQESNDWTPLTLGFSPNGEYAYEATGTNTLSVVSTSAGTVIDTITVGQEPTAMAFLRPRPE